MLPRLFILPAICVAGTLLGCETQPRNNSGHTPIGASTRPVPTPDVDQKRDIRFTGTRWNLTEIAGQPVQHAGGGAGPYLVFTDDGRMTGSGGVNRLNATYERGRRSLTFGPMMSTKMAGTPQMNAQEVELFKQLLMTTRAEVAGGTLTLYAGDTPALVAEAASAE